MNLDSFHKLFLVLQVKDDTVANHFQRTESEGAITELETSGSGSLKSSYHEMNVKVRA